ncbi:MAG: Ig-like domain-containing protein [Spirochaetia bacterium]|nr:Ig-like domain-containing protein [Spirochaetia bacterium]
MKQFIGSVILMLLIGACGSGKKSDSGLFLALGASSGSGGPSSSPETAGSGSATTTVGPSVSPPTTVIQPVATPIETDNDPNLICDQPPAGTYPPLSILKSTPGDGAQAVSVDTPLTLYFSQPLECDSVPKLHSQYGDPKRGNIDRFTSIVLLHEAGQVARETKTIYNADGKYWRRGFIVPSDTSCRCNRVRIKPTLNLMPDSNYWILVSREVRSIKAPFLGPEYYQLEMSAASHTAVGFNGFGAQEIDEAEAKGGLLQFATSVDCPSVDSVTDSAYDSTPFRLCSATPHSRIDVPTSTPIVMKFSKPVDCSMLNDFWKINEDGQSTASQTDQNVFVGLYTPFGGDGRGRFHTQYSCNGRELRLDPRANLPEFAWGMADVQGLWDAKKQSLAFPHFRYVPQINGKWFPNASIINGFWWQWGNVKTESPTCQEDEVLVNNKCVPDVVSELPGGDPQLPDGGPEVACPDRVISVDTTQGQWFTSTDRKTSKDAIKAGVHTFWANQNLILKIRKNCQAGWYKLALTASNIGGPLPEWYEKFNVKVKSDGITIGGIGIQASDDKYNRGVMLVYLKKGDTDLNLLWDNDAYLEGQYDANINLAEIALRYTETHQTSKSLARNAAQYCDVAGRWFWETENSAFTYWDHQQIMFCFPGLEAGKYKVTVEARNHVSELPLPPNYSGFNVRLTSGEKTADTTIKADSKVFKKASVEMDLENGAPITLEWLNDQFEEGKHDTNIEIRKVKLTLIEARKSQLGAYLGGAGGKSPLVVLLILMISVIGIIASRIIAHKLRTR